jgi:hypothetical protein
VGRTARAEALAKRSRLAVALRSAPTAAAPVPVITVEDDPAEFATFAELLTAARKSFHFLVFSADDEPATRLDHHEKASTWRRKAWNALSTLNSYSEARTTGDTDVITLLQFLTSGHPGGRISANTVKLAESDTVTNNPRLREARVFPVSTDVDPSGHAYFGAHISLDRDPPAPRLHFLDNTNHTGLVCIEYLGPRLPVRSTN